MPTIHPVRTSFFENIKATFHENSYFFALFIIFLIGGGINLLLIETGDSILHFSENRSALTDLFFKYGTKLGEEPMYAFFVVFFLFVRFRYSLLIPFVGVIVTVMSSVTKAFFAHPRPFLFFQKMGMLDQINFVEGVTLAKGLSSFPSGHTMSGFALFSLVAFLLNRKKTVAGLLFLIALIVGLSRVYLVQHFFKDIYLGAIIGVSIALVLYAFQRQYPLNSQLRIDQRIGLKSPNIATE
ncbi:MAG: phosphatase PAP2 family protein [Bacteroidota bacterium]